MLTLSELRMKPTNNNEAIMKTSAKLLLSALLVVASAAMGANTLESERTQPYVSWTFPGITVSSPSGYGAQWGQVFVGGGYQSKTRGTTSSDGSIGIGLGLGDPAEYVGLEASVSVYDVSDFNNGGLNLKLHRQLPYMLSVAVGSEALASWGTNSGIRSFFGSVSKIFFLNPDPSEWFSALTLTAGVGNGRFLSTTNLANSLLTGARDGKGTGVNVFGSASIRIKEPVAFIADWTGQDLNLGLSITPIRTLGLFINPSIADVTKTAGNSIRFLIGAGVAYSFI
jgi:hypothetical protein